MTKKSTRDKSNKIYYPKVITRAENPRKAVESYGTNNDDSVKRAKSLKSDKPNEIPANKVKEPFEAITKIPPLSPGNIFETESKNPAAKKHRIHVFEMGRSRFFDDESDSPERLVTFEEDGNVKEMKETEFRKYIQDNKYIKIDNSLSKRFKIELPGGISLGDIYTSPDSDYVAQVVGGNKDIIKVKISVRNGNIDSSFYRMYKAEGFNSEKIFSDDIIKYLGSAYKTDNVEPLLVTDSDEPCEGFWKPATKNPEEKKQGVVAKRVDVKNDTWSTPLDKDTEEGILNLFQTPGEEISKMAIENILNNTSAHPDTIKAFMKMTGNEGFGGTRPMIKTPDIPTEEDLEAFQQAMKEKIKKAAPKPVETNLFEVIGKTKDESSKDVRFTILGNDIDTELMKKINEHQEVEIYQIKRLAAVDVI